MKKLRKKYRKRLKSEMMSQLYFLLLALYAGAARFMISFDGKKKFIKAAQV